MCEALIRSGIYNFVLADFDKVEESNINRQIIATTKTVGYYKVDVMKKRMLEINENANIEIYKTLVKEDTINQINLLDADFIIDAIDMVSSKVLLIQTAKKLNIPVISCMGTGNKLNADMFKIDDISKTSVCPLAKVMRKQLKNCGIINVPCLFSTEEPIKTNCNSQVKVAPASIAFVPSVAGLLIAGYVVKELIKE